MNDEAVVVIPVELWSIAIEAVAFVPFFVLANGVVDAHLIPRFAHQTKECFHGGAEEEPIVEARFDDAAAAKRVDEPLFCAGVEVLP